MLRSVLTWISLSDRFISDNTEERIAPIDHIASLASISENVYRHQIQSAKRARHINWHSQKGSVIETTKRPFVWPEHRLHWINSLNLYKDWALLLYQSSLLLKSQLAVLPNLSPTWLSSQLCFKILSFNPWFDFIFAEDFNFFIREIHYFRFALFLVTPFPSRVIYEFQFNSCFPTV